ncbi:DUF6090 family protein [Tamlana flava]|uniref:DUF6090 family protein n=1 Tax=Tamlana flava TaxID=3158572 RepID=UPI00351ADD9F
MIKFFRRIRLNLLSEGKTGKYLKYAIGEIILVVIGILIALQVNNWNNKRIDNKLEKEYLSRLISELNSDIEYFKDLQSSFKAKQERMDRILGIWKSQNLFIEDSIQYINDFISAGDISPWYNEPTTWTQLIQTGDLKIIKNQKVVDSLFSFYSKLKKSAVNYNDYTFKLVNEARKNWVIPFTVKDYKNNIPPFSTKEVPAQGVFKSISDNLPLYLPLYTSIGITCKLNTWEAGEFAENATELSIQLKSYLDSI